MPQTHVTMIGKCEEKLALTLPEAIVHLQGRLSALDPLAKAGLAFQRLEVALAPLDIKLFLSAQTLFPMIYWQDREAGEEIGGVGIADELRLDSTNFSRLDQFSHQTLSSTSDGVRYFGGACFDDQKKGLEWSGFSAVLFVLPRLEISRSSETFILAVHVRAGKDVQAARHDLGALKDGIQIRSVLPKAVRERDLPRREDWICCVEETTRAIEAKTQSKLVLARRTDVTLAGEADPFAILQRLQEETPGCFHFLFRISSRTCFFGASPERLYRREGRRILSEALAGTRPRGRTPVEEGRFCSELSRSPKEALEHELVVTAIKESLSPLIDTLRADVKPTVTRFKDGQHLLSLIEGELRSGLTDGDILGRLHPTPAVAGSPTKVALEHLRKVEPFSRGWYAGPIGWLGRDKSEFAVAIRSGLLCGHALFLYAGAGIVRGSVAREEWNEVEHKIKSALKVFSL
ncbi:MAG: isochorismate synthase [Candidatus Omnitrophica bacterium]|nr:isochorismate synthase [Candidatus Omnitrophota bacterium]